MATKKQNRRFTKRRVRRALNKALDFFKSASGHKLHITNYGQGVGARQVQDRSQP